MAQKPPSRVELLRGTLDLLILRTLLPGPSHGHAIAKHIQRTSEDLLQVETGSLYPALYRLEANGWIAASWELSEKGKRARYYRITPKGRKQLASEQSKWDAFARAMGLLLKPADRGGTMTSLFRKFTWWLQRRRKEDELREELQFHLAEEAGERQADGLPEDQARWAARRDLGNVTLLQEDTRTLWSWILLEQLAQDVRYGLRTMFKNRSVHGPGRTLARAGDRRQHGDLQLHGLDPVALAAGVGPGVAGGREMAQQSRSTPARERVRHALRRRQHLPRPFGHHGGDLSRSRRSSACRRHRRRSCPASSRTNRPAA